MPLLLLLLCACSMVHLLLLVLVLLLLLIPPAASSSPIPTVALIAHLCAARVRGRRRHYDTLANVLLLLILPTVLLLL